MANIVLNFHPNINNIGQIFMPLSLAKVNAIFIFVYLVKVVLIQVD